MRPTAPYWTATILAVLCLAAGPAAAGMAPIQDYVDSAKAGQRDHGYPLVRCGALYMASLKVAGDSLAPEKADQVMSTAMKMVAIATTFRLKPGDDAGKAANAVMDEVEGFIAAYEADGGASFNSGALVKKDFKYCRNFAEPFARNYNMDPPKDAQ